MFEDMRGESLDSNAANDLSALVPMHVNDQLERAFTLPVMSVAFSWSREMLSAVVTFCRYQMDTAGSRAEMRAEVQSYDVICSTNWLNTVSCVLFPGKSLATLGRQWPWQKYESTSALLVNKLEGGFTKRQYYEEKRLLQARRQDDLVRIENFPRLDERKARSDIGAMFQALFLHVFFVRIGVCVRSTFHRHAHCANVLHFHQVSPSDSESLNRRTCSRR